MKECPVRTRAELQAKIERLRARENRLCQLELLHRRDHDELREAVLNDPDHDNDTINWALGLLDDNLTYTQDGVRAWQDEKQEIERLQASIGTEKRMRKDSDDQAEELRAIVAKLPKTADGVPVVPGMVLFDRVPQQCGHAHIRKLLPNHTVEENGKIRRFGHVHGWGVMFAANCYSTREAAKEVTDE